MRRQRFPLIASEGVPFFVATLAAGFAGHHFLGPTSVAGTVAILAILFLIFRDPGRQIPAEPLGVVSPVDGVLESVEEAADPDGMHVLKLRIHTLGNYIARAPVEGKVDSLRAREDGERFGSHALLLQTDEGDDVILLFRGLFLGIPPRGLKGYGERFGQGQRCAYLRLTRRAELYLPAQSKILKAAGDRVTAGETLLARLPTP